MEKIDQTPLAQRYTTRYIESWKRGRVVEGAPLLRDTANSSLTIRCLLSSPKVSQLAGKTKLNARVRTHFGS